MPIPYERLVALLTAAESLRDTLESTGQTAQSLYTRALRAEVDPLTALADLTLICQHPPIRRQNELLIAERTRYNLTFSKVEAERLRRKRRACGTPPKAPKSKPPTPSQSIEPDFAAAAPPAAQAPQALQTHQQTLQRALALTTENSADEALETAFEAPAAQPAPQTLEDFLSQQFGDLPDHLPAPGYTNMTIGEAKKIMTQAWDPEGI
jgi:hypothetical protein